METGSDILFFWVARMIMLGIYATGEVPFKTVYLHGLVRDVNRQKMSKSKGNVISPIEMSDKYGTDALRMALIVGNTPGSDMALAEDKIKGYKHFANKIWNASRFVLEKRKAKPVSQVRRKAKENRQSGLSLKFFQLLLGHFTLLCPLSRKRYGQCCLQRIKIF